MLFVDVLNVVMLNVLMLNGMASFLINFQIKTLSLVVNPMMKIT